MMQQGTQEWLAERRSGIGGSEAAVLYPDPASPTGCHHPWLTPYKLWALKTGRLESEPAHPSTAPALWWGTALEDDVRDAYELVTGRTVTDGATMVRHPTVGCMIANTDGTIAEAEDFEGPGVYEGKTTTIHNRDAWEAGVPLYYRVQVNWYLACLDLQWGGVGLFMGGSRDPLKIFDVERHQRLIDDMCERADRWWDKHVKADTPPDVDGSRQTERTVKLLFPSEDEARVQKLGDGFDAVQSELANLRAWRKAIEVRERALKNQVMAAMGDAEYGELASGSGWRFSTTKRDAYTVEAKEFRQLKPLKDIEKHRSKKYPEDKNK